MSCFIWGQNEASSPGVGTSDGSEVPAPKRWGKASLMCDRGEGGGTAAKCPPWQRLAASPEEQVPRLMILVLF